MLQHQCEQQQAELAQATEQAAAKEQQLAALQQHLEAAATSAAGDARQHRLGAAAEHEALKHVRVRFGVILVMLP